MVMTAAIKDDWRLLLLSAYREDARYLRMLTRYPNDDMSSDCERRMAEEARKRYRNYRRKLKREGIIGGPKAKGRATQ
jgi:hypothetical protein